MNFINSSFKNEVDTLNNYSELRQLVLNDGDNTDRYYAGPGDENYNEEWIKEDIDSALGFVWENCSFKDPNERILIARCINLEDIQDFDIESMGNSWTSPKNFYAFASQNLSKKNLYCITAKTEAHNIDWVRSVLLYIYNDYEYELYVKDDTPDEIWDIRLWKVENGKMVNIKNNLETK